MVDTAPRVYRYLSPIYSAFHAPPLFILFYLYAIIYAIWRAKAWYMIGNLKFMRNFPPVFAASLAVLFHDALLFVRGRSSQKARLGWDIAAFIAMAYIRLWNIEKCTPSSIQGTFVMIMHFQARIREQISIDDWAFRRCFPAEHLGSWSPTI